MPTVRAIAEEALQELGVLAEGETATDADAELGRTKLNSLVDQWAAERLQIYTVTRTTWTLVSGTQNYTVGSGGDVNIARPVYVDHINYVDTSTSPVTEYPLGEPLTEAAWAAITQKALTATVPNSVYYNPTFPLATTSFWPVPTRADLQGVIYVPTAVGEFAALSTNVALPPGYRRMIVNRLAMELASSFGREPKTTTVMAARDATKVVKRANIRLEDMALDRAALGQLTYGDWDINTGP